MKTLIHAVRARLLSVVVASALILVFAVKGFPQESLRPLTTDNLFDLEEIGQVAISPDGQWLAYVVKRPKRTASIQLRPFMEGNDRGDVWLVSTAGGKPQNLTNGAADSSGWWAPVWSPDSQRLAVFSTRGGNVRLWLWEKYSKRLKQLTERGVDTLVGSAAWVNNQQLICVVLPEGQKPNAMTIELRGSEIASSEATKAWSGNQTTSSVLESGLPPALDKRPKSELLLTDIAKATTVLAAGYSFRDVRVSSDQQHVAALVQVDTNQPQPGKVLPPMGVTQAPIYQAIALTSDRKPMFSNLSSVSNVQTGSLQWSPDGKSLALIGNLTGSDLQQAIKCSFRLARCEPLPSTYEPSALLWAQRDGVLMLTKATATSRQDWWLFDASDSPRNLTANMKSVPSELYRETDGEGFVGLAAGDLWRIHPDVHEPDNLTKDFEPRISSVVARTATSATRVLVSVRTGAQMTWYEINLLTGEILPLSKPHTDGSLVAVNLEHRIAVVTASDRAGTYLWLTKAPFTESTRILELNSFLNRIAQSELRKIDYRTSDGADLKAWVILPVGYQSGKNYPLITVVYAGAVYSDSPPPMIRTINNASSMNYQLLAAHGYAVLLPSMPAGLEPYAELTKGVLPAVDKVIEEGIADPKRLGLFGHSYGGYSVYGLVTQTNRFQAAVASAGLSDLVSIYGTFDARFRYDQFPQERLSLMNMAETGQIRMGNPPWKDFDRYVHNSPIFYVNKIETPLMIIQGDYDMVPIQQGEEVFSALYRQNKRSQFVRYWGEGHVVEGQANVRDFWGRICRWFDEAFSKQE